MLGGWLGTYGLLHMTMAVRQYLTIEVNMKEFSEAIHIPMSHLDFVLWYKETGEILK